MKKYKVVFMILGTEYTSTPCLNEMADVQIKQLKKQGISNAKKVELTRAF